MRLSLWFANSILFLIYLFSFGICLLSFFKKSLKDISIEEQIPLALVAGAFSHYSLSLIILDFKLLTYLSVPIILFGSFLSFQSIKLGRPSIYFSIWFFIFLLYGVSSLMLPIDNLDPQTLWFLWSKQMFLKGSIDFTPVGLLHNENHHLSYPKLVSSLAAEFAYLNGYWNDTMAKYSLAILSLPVFLFLSCFCKNIFSFFILFFATLGLKEWLLSSFIDGYLAFFIFLSALFLSKQILTQNKKWEIYNLFTVGIILSLKNDGVLWGGLTFLFLIYYRKSLKPNWFYWFFSLTPYLLWKIRFQSWGFKNDLGFNAAFMNKIFERISQESERKLFWSYMTRDLFQLSLFIWLLCILLLLVGKNRKIIRVTLCFIIGYSLGLFLIYLGTPHDLDWHLRTSWFRTQLTIQILAYIPLFIATQNTPLTKSSQ